MKTILKVCILQLRQFSLDIYVCIGMKKAYHANATKNECCINIT